MTPGFVVFYPAVMEGISRQLGAAAAEYERAHPEVSIWRAGELWRAWIEDAAGSRSGTELRPCRKLDDLLARLDVLLARLGG
jgi:hypothetical protein